MTTQYETETEPGVGSLLSGIMLDARKLIVQQLTLFQTEIKNDMHRATAALTPIILGASVCLAAIVLLGLAGAHFLNWLIPAIPLWASLAGAGGLVAAVGACLLMSGNVLLDRVNLTPDKTLEGLKENIQWKTKT